MKLKSRLFVSFSSLQNVFTVNFLSLSTTLWSYSPLVSALAPLLWASIPIHPLLLSIYPFHHSFIYPPCSSPPFHPSISCQSLHPQRSSHPIHSSFSPTPTSPISPSHHSLIHPPPPVPPQRRWVLTFCIRPWGQSIPTPHVPITVTHTQSLRLIFTCSLTWSVNMTEYSLCSTMENHSEMCSRVSEPTCPTVTVSSLHTNTNCKLIIKQRYRWNWKMMKHETKTTFLHCFSTR